MRDPQSSISEWLAAIGVVHMMGEPTSNDNGTPYTTLAMGVEKPEGSPMPDGHSSVSIIEAGGYDKLIEEFKENFAVWLGDRKRIVWRLQPELVVNPYKDTCVIYCRCCAYP